MGVLSDVLRDADFGYFIQSLFDGGWYQFVFPFMLVYAVVFTISNKIKVFDNKKPVKIIVSLVFALFAIAFPITGDAQYCGVSTGLYSSYGCETLGDLMMSLFPGISAFSIAILALYIVAAMLGVDLTEFFDKNGENPMIRNILGVLGVVVVVYYYARGFGWDGFDGSGPSWLVFVGELLSDPGLYVLLVFGLFFWWVTREEDSAKESFIKKFMEENPDKKRADAEKAYEGTLSG